MTPRERSVDRRHLPFALVLFVVLVGMGFVSTAHWRKGSLLIGAAMLLAAGLRVFLPQERLGLLAIRSRVVDVVLYSALGVAIVVVAVTIQGGLFG
ncbi:Protein of unknown function (DUF3017) [Streptoalloteichus tenebrarius]|uniref:DUF3017 domain-containing protein n=1 Tax=Streptoalloteichus tenebrarius (strain ATCC 17920 / DSM 40477 / JCM 4838 / CBS 697.72 / NBRC 16177 / NCIMB 11028 / NRRL B-12390 / A12253. 1 / ISP 5477) TaxID=1933 RepID=A0ABT1I181_STRSD|nr:DUF3017 domain-containing protein [Streptoalloteichus tenebrarius]MCP2261546.1 Protein of unknown function (DUF3017) [Streptoalloteichus tenebrarius]BFF02679.1 hypothetical protein GCM10020241_43540 [Streptoalloteichus tenebrarius]